MIASDSAQPVYIEATTRIHGKTVNFLMYDQIADFPRPAQFLSLLARKLPSIDWKRIVTNDGIIPFFKGVAQAYIRHDKKGVFDNMMIIIKRKMAEVLYQHPELIALDQIRIHIQFVCDNNMRKAVLYLNQLSDIVDVYFRFNLSGSFFASFAGRGENFIEGIVSHEMLHPMDSDLRKRYRLALQKLKDKMKAEDSGVSMGSYLLFLTFVRLRMEAVAFFVEQLKNARCVEFKPHFIRRLAGFIDELPISPAKEVDDDTLESVYYVSAMMASLIVLKRLLSAKSGIWVWISFQRRFFGIKWRIKPDCSADRIGEFYGVRKFRLVFGDADDDKAIFRILFGMKTWSHLRFLGEYESACAYFDIKEPYFSLEKYKKSKAECWQAHQELLRENGFVK
ncbi:hypothetical protein HYT54_04510 [Candidatus Woesearchaeota archaeon]|nr:hypothetical protein [Candidatus Woesearchaeota archaeon]